MDQGEDDGAMIWMMEIIEDDFLNVEAEGVADMKKGHSILAPAGEKGIKAE